MVLAVRSNWLSNPYLLGQIGLVGNFLSHVWMTPSPRFRPLPIRSNRISWKQNLVDCIRDECPLPPYLLGQIGLVGNPTKDEVVLTQKFCALGPYLLGQIGLVGNKKSRANS